MADDFAAKETLAWFRNSDGSYVQCSGGMLGGQRGDYARQRCHSTLSKAQPNGTVPVTTA